MARSKSRISHSDAGDTRRESTAGRSDAETQRTKQERKRITDRAAQRAHRMRQRQYVQELQAEIASLKRHVSSSNAKSLFEENVKLRQEVQSLKNLLSTIQSLAARGIPDTPLDPTKSPPGEPTSPISPPAADCNSPDSGAHKTVRSSNDASRHTATPKSADLAHAISEKIDEADGAEDTDLATAPYLVQNHSAPELQIPWTTGMEFCEPQTSVSNAQSLSGDWSHSMLGSQSQPQISMENFGWNIFHTSPPMSGKPQSNMNATTMQISPHFQESTSVLNPFLSSLFQPPAGSIMDATSTPQDSLTDTALRLITSHNMRSHLRMIVLPDIAPYALDVRLHEIIERARTREIAQKARVAPPVLSSFLVDSETDATSIEVKRYVETTRQRKPVQLGMFFLVYSIVRWQVNQDLETLRETPEWLRPTKTQLEIQHPLPLDFFIWPLIRSALVKLSQTNPAKAYEFLLTSCAFTQLDVDPASLLGSTEEDLLLTVSNINNWKLHPTFFEIYPEWRQLYEQHLKT